MKTKRSIFIFLFATLSWFSFSQNVKTDMEKLNKKYLGTQRLSYTANYKLFAGNNTVPVETYFTSHKKSGDNYFTKNEDEEYMVNKKYIVFVDHESKEVLIQENTDKKNSEVQKMIEDTPNIMANLDTLMSFYKSIESLASSSPDSRGYRFFMKAGQYSKVDMVIDTKQWLLRELVLYFSQPEEINGKAENVRIKITFENYSTSIVNESDFSETKYVSLNGRDFKVKPGYSKYTLYDQTSH